MKLSILVIGFLLINALMLGFGAFFYAGVVDYGVSNGGVDFRLFNQTDALYGVTNNQLTNMTQSGIETTPSIIGNYYYLKGLVGTVFNVLIYYPALGTNFMVSLLSGGFFVLPDWIAGLLGVLIGAVFLFALVNVFTPREV